MPDRSPLTTSRYSGSQQDWPTLIGQAVDDVSRILQSEADILQTRVGEAVKDGISDSIGVVSMVALFIWGAGCILLSSILLLHEWLPLWLSFGVVGLFTTCVAGLGWAVMKQRPDTALVSTKSEPQPRTALTVH